MSDTITTLGLDLGRSGKTATSILTGSRFRVTCDYMDAVPSISAIDVVTNVGMLYEDYPEIDLILLESNGPGGVFAEFAKEKHPQWPIVTVDTSHPAFDLWLWDEQRLTPNEFLNIRAEMYWLARLFFKDRRIKLSREDPEFMTQMASTPWDFDKQRNDRIYLPSKRTINIQYRYSELEGETGSRSPDKADSFCLALLAFCLLSQEEVNSGPVAEDEIYQPEHEGFFNIGVLGDL
jgi:hypothetical protein